MPEPVRYCAASDVKTGHGQTEGMTRQTALVDVSPNICGTLMRAHPHSASAIHHHGEQNTIVYAVSGNGAVVSADGKSVSSSLCFVCAVLSVREVGRSWFDEGRVGDIGEACFWGICIWKVMLTLGANRDSFSNLVIGH